MAKYSHLVVLTGVFLTAILLQYLFVMSEGFAPKKKPAKRGTPKRGTPKKGTPKRGTPKKGKGTPKKGGKGTPKKGGKGTPKKGGKGTPKKGGKGTPKRGKGTPKRGKGTPKGGKGTPKRGKGTPKGGKGKGKKGTTPRKGKKMMTASQDTGVAGVPASKGMKFSELIQSLIAYTPGGRQAAGAPYATGLGMPATAAVGAAGGAELANQVRAAVRDELASTRNSSLANRSTTPTVPTTPSVTSPSLNQGQFMRGPTTPYGAAQPAPTIIINTADQVPPQPPVDMSQYVPRSNVYGL